MRHRVYGRHLGRTTDARKALFKNLVQSLFLSESIQTTESKAKAIKGLVDEIITSAKSPTRQKLVTSFLHKKDVQEKLFSNLIPRVGKRTSGFTSITKMGRRQGDGAMIVKMSLLVEEKAAKKESTKKEEDLKEESKEGETK